jgi:hypothetical protein
MLDNPYKAPSAPVELQKPVQEDGAAGRKIRNAWIAGVASAGITLIFIAIALSGGTPIAGIDAWALVDVAIILGLSYGVYRKSRICAVLLLLFFLVNRIAMWAESGTVSGLPLALVFLWFLGQGVVGTFQHHRLERTSAEPVRPAPKQQHAR